MTGLAGLGLVGCGEVRSGRDKSGLVRCGQWVWRVTVGFGSVG